MKSRECIIREKIYDILISRNLCIEESTLRKNLDDDLQKNIRFYKYIR